jgi:hypothetical protein
MNRRTFLAAAAAVPVLVSGEILIDNTPVRKTSRLDPWVQAVYRIAKDYPGIHVVETGNGPLLRRPESYSHELRLTYTAGKQTCFSVAWLPDKDVYARDVGYTCWQHVVRNLFEVAEENRLRGSLFV